MSNSNKKKTISAFRMKNWESEVPFDNVWIKINTNNSVKLLVNCIYLQYHQERRS